ncbi:hypothetical protein VTJ04DRAFT_10796 [Mycothermus thermophilus]|uniref:uncharacterized protein n=1 Tax=Humicola insolens TaxID=85995 RepID=UPI003744398D
MVCRCTQEVLNAIVYCKGEYRICWRDYDADADLDALISEWDSRCAPYVSTMYPSSGVTTPTLSWLSGMLRRFGV